MNEFQDADPDMPELSGAALEALKEFYADRDARQKQFEDLKSKKIAEVAGNQPLTMDAFAENWNDSQFWYCQETADILARQLLANCNSKSTIAVVSTPSVFVQLKNIIIQAGASMTNEQIPKIYLLEFDKRFAVFPEFVFYDFHNPLKLPESMKGSVDHIICDPPFLSEDCQTKAALTVRWLSKSWGAGTHAPDNSSVTDLVAPRLIVSTGERMGVLVNKLYHAQGIRTTTFEPMHAKGLSNEFHCYSNFECDNWKWRT